ncbi:thioesterase family protein [Phaeovibrio sulfidiphilus]|uniref:Thioesterase family protein n=1 Tax=Phaeovibrio sulfidiphilus TaxID=1220600 RepID=A0A8J6YMR7_9PROT|nr:thioesterase family protein [Phaeovibrio sulfidiphilus]MBE1237465.1 thioesterase family protein [Phaeovibrio sulfidiphilus]
MNLLFRLMRVFLVSRFVRKRTFLETAILSFRVWPTDLDINAHMTNSRYYSFMDLGRIDHVLRTQVGDYVLKHRLNFIVGGGMTRHRHAMNPFQKFTLHSQILGWDARWFYMEHRMKSEDGKELCVSFFRSAFLRKGRIVPPAELLELSGLDLSSPALPDWIAEWNDVDRKAAEYVPPSPATPAVREAA